MCISTVKIRFISSRGKTMMTAFSEELAKRTNSRWDNVAFLDCCRGPEALGGFVVSFSDNHFYLFIVIRSFSRSFYHSSFKWSIIEVRSILSNFIFSRYLLNFLLLLFFLPLCLFINLKLILLFNLCSFFII